MSVVCANVCVWVAGCNISDIDILSFVFKCIDSQESFIQFHSISDNFFSVLSRVCRDEVTKELRSALSQIKLSQEGVYVQASTLGSLEALLEFLKVSKIPVSWIYYHFFIIANLIDSMLASDYFLANESINQSLLPFQAIRIMTFE